MFYKEKIACVLWSRNYFIYLRDPHTFLNRKTTDIGNSVVGVFFKINQIVMFLDEPFTIYSQDGYNYCHRIIKTLINNKVYYLFLYDRDFRVLNV